MEKGRVNVFFVNFTSNLNLSWFNTSIFVLKHKIIDVFHKYQMRTCLKEEKKGLKMSKIGTFAKFTKST